VADVNQKRRERFLAVKPAHCIAQGSPNFHKAINTNAVSYYSPPQRACVSAEGRRWAFRDSLIRVRVFYPAHEAALRDAVVAMGRALCWKTGVRVGFWQPRSAQSRGCRHLYLARDFRDVLSVWPHSKNDLLYITILIQPWEQQFRVHQICKDWILTEKSGFTICNTTDTGDLQTNPRVGDRFKRSVIYKLACI